MWENYVTLHFDILWHLTMLRLRDELIKRASVIRLNDRHLLSGGWVSLRFFIMTWWQTDLSFCLGPFTHFEALSYSKWHARPVSRKYCSCVSMLTQVGLERAGRGACISIFLSDKQLLRLNTSPIAMLSSAGFHILHNYRVLDWKIDFLQERKSGLA